MDWCCNPWIDIGKISPGIVCTLPHNQSQKEMMTHEEGEQSNVRALWVIKISTERALQGAIWNQTDLEHFVTVLCWKVWKLRMLRKSGWRSWKRKSQSWPAGLGASSSCRLLQLEPVQENFIVIIYLKSDRPYCMRSLERQNLNDLISIFCSEWFSRFLKCRLFLPGRGAVWWLIVVVLASALKGL